MVLAFLELQALMQKGEGPTKECQRYVWPYHDPSTWDKMPQYQKFRDWSQEIKKPSDLLQELKSKYGVTEIS